MVPPISLTPEEQKTLRRQQRRAVGRVSERIHYVLLFARGYPISEISTLYQVDERTVETWLERFRIQGVGGLDDLPRRGRPRTARAAAEAEAIRCLEGSAEEMGVERTTWTRRLLQRHLGERLDCWLSKSSLTRLIARLGFVWSRPKLGVRLADPEELAREEMNEIIATAARTFPGAPCLFEDECDVHQLPVVRGQYQRRGRQTEVPTPGTNHKQAVFGFLEARSGQWHYFLTAHRRSRDFLECLHELLKRYPTGDVLLFVDNASIHKSRVTLRWLERHPRIHLLYLPSYSGHKCNPVEKVWWALKDSCAANQLYPSIEAVQDAIHGFFSRFTQEAARQLTVCNRPLGIPPEPLARAA